MSDPTQLYATLTGNLEDLHGLAVEGQAADQPAELLLMLADQICNGLHRCQRIADQIKTCSVSHDRSIS
ncbi:hypothetical protein FG91_01666 [Sphingopyxis sp. LC81]|uniref:hypothetical protein n=1 Tax=Sphingopyxis sp. LC81 TaxID=1502850 RepID=UPI00050E0E42|nr:hypothetical protein [Sphingopyxis sp. LC81]KGB55036.1 hypothetical protein FG91_01666 [Sphingopyxis sp. LC81]